MKRINENGKVFVIMPVPENYYHGFISSTGRSVVYRALGTYISSSGQIKGQNEALSPYLYRELPIRSIYPNTPVLKETSLLYDIDGLIMPCFKIPIN